MRLSSGDQTGKMSLPRSTVNCESAPRASSKIHRSLGAILRIRRFQRNARSVAR